MTTRTRSKKRNNVQKCPRKVTIVPMSRCLTSSFQYRSFFLLSVFSSIRFPSVNKRAFTATPISQYLASQAFKHHRVTVSYNQTVNDGVAHSKNPRKCAYYVTFDLDLDIEHTLYAGLPGDHSVQVWSRSSYLPGRRSDFRPSTKVPVSLDL